MNTEAQYKRWSLNDVTEGNPLIDTLDLLFKFELLSCLLPYMDRFPGPELPLPRPSGPRSPKTNALVRGLHVAMCILAWALWVAPCLDSVNELSPSGPQYGLRTPALTEGH